MKAILRILLATTVLGLAATGAAAQGRIIRPTKHKPAPQQIEQTAPQTIAPTTQPNVRQNETSGELFAKGIKFYNNGDFYSAEPYLRKAAKRGHAEAQNLLGELYYHGNGSCTENHYEAARWYRRAAEQGNASGQYNLGYMYYTGKGVSQNYNETVKWYRKAAEQGNARAQNSLGWMYENGVGVSKDISESVKWYKKAAKQGNTSAQRELIRLGYYN